MTEFCTSIWNIFCLGDVYIVLMHLSPILLGASQKIHIIYFYLLYNIKLKGNQVLTINEKMKSWSKCKLARQHRKLFVIIKMLRKVKHTNTHLCTYTPAATNNKWHHPSRLAYLTYIKSLQSPHISVLSFQFTLFHISLYLFMAEKRSRRISLYMRSTTSTNDDKTKMWLQNNISRIILSSILYNQNQKTWTDLLEKTMRIVIVLRSD